MPIRAILFDLDETLIDWSDFRGNWWELEPLHLRNVYNYIADGFPVEFDSDKFVQEFSRRSRLLWNAARDSLVAPHVGTLLVETASALGVPDEHIDRDQFITAYGWGPAEGTRPFAEVHRVLARLKGHGFELGIITNSFLPMRMRDAELDAHDLTQYFPRCRLSAADAGFLKPHPEVFRRALTKIGVGPKEAVFVGDNLAADILGAKSVGMKAVWRKPAAGGGGREYDIKPDATIQTLDELPGLIAMWL
ncbi:MAG: HAD family hydrolase [Chloroflexi bacterium OLB13]|nr:MAG: HAD family hydrolase [Chloroflexi bacterium OLB13]